MHINLGAQGDQRRKIPGVRFTGSCNMVLGTQLGLYKVSCAVNHSLQHGHFFEGGGFIPIW